MFDSVRRKSRRRKSMRSRRRGPRARSRMRFSRMGSFVKIGGLVVAVAALAALVIFVIIPLFDGGEPAEQEANAEATNTPAPTPSPIAKEDMSEDAHELIKDPESPLSINDPYINGNDVVFSTGDPKKSTPQIDTIAVYDITTEQITNIEKIEAKYDSLFEPKINENYIVYVDCKTEYGGAVCGYDRAADEMFVMREYLYGKPKVSLAGEYALWMQQTGPTMDKLYLYHLPTKESTVIEIFVKTPFAISAPYMSDEAIVYVQPENEEEILKNSYNTTVAEIMIIPLTEKGDQKRETFLPGIYAYDPMIEGDYIVFLDSNRDDNSKLMLTTKTAGTYSAPIAIAEGVLNYHVGDGFVAYTKDDAIYVYYFVDGSMGRVSSENTRGMLASAKGKDVVWYDITDGLDASADVIMHAQVP